MKKIFNFSSMLLAYMILAFSAQAATIYVDATTGNNGNSGATPALAKQTIVGALAIAASGDVIMVAAGTYNETFVIMQNVTITGPQVGLSPSGPSRYSTNPAGIVPEAIIQFNNANAVEVAPGFTVTLQGLTFNNLNTGRCFRAQSLGATVTYYRNRSFGANAGGVAIARFEDCANITVLDNHFYKTTGLTGAINILATGAGLVSGNLIEVPMNNSFGSIHSAGSSNLTIQNNVIRTNQNSGIEVQSGTPSMNVMVVDNDIIQANTTATANEGGVRVSGGMFTNLSILRNKIIDAMNSINIVNGNHTGDNTLINDNLFTGTGLGNLVGILHEGNGIIDGTNNAWGNNGNSGPDVASNPGQAGNFQITGTSAALITYNPWRTCNQDGVPTVFSDAGITGAGFQPGLSSPPTVGAAPNPVCAGQTLNLTSSLAGLTYAWTGPNTFMDATQNPTLAITSVAQSGIYSLTVTDGNGCTAALTTASVTVLAPPAPSSALMAAAAPVNGTGITVYWVGVAGFPKYRIAYRVYGATTWQYTAVFTAQTYYTPGANYGKLYGAVTGLQVGTRYEFAVQASCGTGGFSPLSSPPIGPVSTNAQTSLSCYGPTDIFTESASLTSGVVSFQVDAGTYSCVQVAYGPYDQPPTSLSWKTVNVPAPGSPYITQNYTITGLTTGVKYGARVRTICAAGCPAVTTNLTNYSGIYPFTAGAMREGESGENISDVSIENAVLAVYPNPSRGSFSLKADGAEPNTPVQIYDMTGKMVHQTATIENAETRIDLSGQPAGVYLLKAGAQSLKVIIE